MKKNELESAIASASKYYLPKTSEPPQIFARPSAAAASKDAIANEIVKTMETFDKKDVKKEMADGQREADILRDVKAKNDQYGDML